MSFFSWNDYRRIYGISLPDESRTPKKENREDDRKGVPSKNLETALSVAAKKIRDLIFYCSEEYQKREPY